MSFEALIEELDTLQKARSLAEKPHEEPDGDEAGGAPMKEGEPDGDEKIQAIAGKEAVAKEKEQAAEPEKKGKKKGEDEKAEEGMPPEEGEEGMPPEEGEEGMPPEEGEEDEVLGKSFGVTLEDGTTVEAYDATLVLKAFDDRITNLADRSDGLTAKIGDMVTKDELMPILQKQSELIKSLSAQIDALRGEGRGRKSVLTVHEKPEIGEHRPAPATVRADELLTKAMVAVGQGRLSGNDVARLEAYIGRGLAPPPEIMKIIA